MSIDEKKAITREFLETLDKKGLIRFNSNLWDDLHMENIQRRTAINANAYLKITENYWKDNEHFGIPVGEMAIFGYTFGVNFITSSLELIKTFLITLIDPEKIRFDEETTLGTALRHICDELGYDKKQRKIISDNFFLDFRNVISHQNYEITETGVFIKKDGTRYDFEKLTELTNEVRVIMEAITDYANKKTIKLQKIATELNKKTAQLNKRLKKMNRNNARIISKSNQ